METKIINVYYGQDLLPYKDVERVVHYPITSGAFLGASNTTKIRFYFDYIGNENTTWVSVAKLPNGKQGSKVLPVASDENGNYAELELSNWYSQAKGDVYIALQGYQGGVEYEYDSETELYEIHGTPTIQTTGSIKLAINYAPIGDSPDYNDEFSTYQEILALLGDKASLDTVVLFVDLSEYPTYQALFDYVGDRPFAFIQDNELRFGYFKSVDSDYILVICNNSGVYSTATIDFTSAIDLSTDIVELDLITDNLLVLTNASGTLTDKQYQQVEKDNCYIKLGDNYYRKTIETNDYYEFEKLSISSAGGVVVLIRNYITITKATKQYQNGSLQLTTYTSSTISSLLNEKADTSYVNTQLATKQNTLVSGTNIKTINGQSILGSGDLPISGGGSAEWGAISGDIQDQTDLQDELQNIREVAEGKNKTLVISYLKIAPTTNEQAQTYKKPDGTPFTDLADFNIYVSGLTLRNSVFNSQDSVFTYGNFYLIDSENVVYRCEYLAANFKVGDIILVSETDVPDRWVSYIGPQNMGYPLGFSKLETTKIDLTNYATTGDLSIARYEIEREIAPEYFPTNTYAIGDKVIYGGKLYTCTTAIDTPETWDSTKWSQISVASGFVDLDKAQVITGAKTFQNTLKTTLSSSYPTWNLTGYGASGLDIIYSDNSKGLKLTATLLRPQNNNDMSLGNSSYTFKDLYLSGQALVHTIKMDATSGNGIVANDNNDINFIFGSNTYYRLTNQMFRPMNDNARDLGQGTLRWRDAYIGRNISDGTNSVTVADLANLIAYAKSQGWIS